MTIRTELARLLKTVTDEDSRSLGRIAQSLGFSRQRLHQLRIGDASAAPEAIERALNDLGYEIQVGLKDVRKIDNEPKEENPEDLPDLRPDLSNGT